MSSAEALAGLLPSTAYDRLVALDQAVLDALPSALYVCSGDGVIVRYNRKATELWRRTPRVGDTDERFSRSFRLSRLDGQSLPHASTAMVRALRTGEPQRDQEMRIGRPDGSQIVALANIEVLKDGAGRVQGAVSVFHNIGDRNRREDEAQSRPADVDDFFESAVAAMHWVGPDGTILKANQAELDLLGYARDDYVGRNIADFHVDRQESNGILRGLARGDTLDSVPARLRAKDGSIKHVRVNSRARIRDGEFINTRCVTFDVTEAVRAEESLATRMAEQSALFDFTDALYRAETHADVYESAVDAILRALRCDRASVLLLDNSNVMRFVAWRGLSNGYREAVEGHSPWSADTKDPQPISIHDVGKADLPQKLREVVLSEGIRALSFVPVMAGGKLAGKFMTYYDSPHTFTDAELDLAVTVARQLGFSVERRRAEDARVRAEKERRNNEERERRRAAELRAVLESVPAIIWIAHDPECHSVTGNPAAQRFLRLAPDANPSLSAGKDRSSHFQVVVDGRVLSPEELPVQRAARGEEVHNFEEEVRFSDGTSSYLLGNATPLRDEEGNPRGSVAAFVDITDRRRTELALQNSQEHLQLALETGKMGAWHWDIGSGRVQWSPGLEQIHGLEPGTFGGTFEDWKRVVAPEDLPAALAEIEKALTTGQDYHVLYRVRHIDGSVRWLEGFGRIVAEGEGGGGRMAGVCMDVTERQLADSQREFLVQELSHRVKNTLATVISIQNQTFAKASSFDEAQASFGARIRALAQTHGRLAEGNWTGVALQTVVGDELAPYRHENGENVKLSGPPVMLNAKSALTLGMAIHELVTNAAKHGALSRKTGTVAIAWERDPGNNELRIRWSESGGPAVVRPARSGFGRLLLERVLTADLGGKVELTFAADGLRCEIVVPLAENVAGSP